jgi:hypothetical protein
MDNETKKSVFEYSLRVTGIFGRNRKTKFATFQLLDSEAPVELTKLTDKVTQTLLDIKAKPGCKWRLSETPVEVGVISRDGVEKSVSRSFMLFSGTILAEGVV